MKNILLSCGLAVALTAGLFAVNAPQSGIVGSVSPVDGAESVWAISATDSARGIINAGNFSLTVKPGTYKLYVDAKDPYQDVILDVEVQSNRSADVGQIILKNK